MIRRLTLSAFRSAEAESTTGIVPTNASYKNVLEKQKVFLVKNTTILCYVKL